jgi:hypothetical protein
LGWCMHVRRFVVASVGIGVGVCLWCGWGCEWGLGVWWCGCVRCLSVGCQGVSKERAVGSHGAVGLTWGVVWLV